MPKRKEEEKYAISGEKDCWHSYSLQVLHPSQFTNVVGKILRGQYTLVLSKVDNGNSSNFN